MKPPEDAKKRLVREWLGKAHADFDLAEHLVAEKSVFLDAIAFHCQQAAEKYLKALLTWWGMEFPKTHVLATLLNLIESRDAELAASLSGVIPLTPYDAELRYPGDRPGATPDQAREALELARLVRDKVLPLLPRPADLEQ